MARFIVEGVMHAYGEYTTLFQIVDAPDADDAVSAVSDNCEADDVDVYDLRAMSVEAYIDHALTLRTAKIDIAVR